MLELLKANPGLTPDELPNAQEWVDRFFGKPVTLVPSSSFVGQVAKLFNADYRWYETSCWDPHEEGYDDGPGVLDGCWHTNDWTSAGLYRGTVVAADFLFDEFGATIVASFANTLVETDEDAHELFREFCNKNWAAPLSLEQRDENLIKRLVELAKGLTQEGKNKLVALLS